MYWKKLPENLVSKEYFCVDVRFFVCLVQVELTMKRFLLSERVYLLIICFQKNFMLVQATYFLVEKRKLMCSSGLDISDDTIEKIFNRLSWLQLIDKIALQENNKAGKEEKDMKFVLFLRVFKTG